MDREGQKEGRAKENREEVDKQNRRFRSMLETMEMMRDMDVSTRDGFLGAEILSNLDEEHIVEGGTGLHESRQLENGRGGGGGLVSSNGKIICEHSQVTDTENVMTLQLDDTRDFVGLAPCAMFKRC